MAKRCVRCASCIEKDGVKMCSRDGAVVSDEDRARFYDGKCWTKIVPKKKTREEISAIRSLAGKKGGETPKRGKAKVKRTSVQVAIFDRDVLERYAVKMNMSQFSAFHHLCRVILQNHPDIKKPDGWVD